ncbi:hypothetical protein DFH27DRAFT_52121 [Peziza echinospora]|nr:hypothetical protein DFH27DRAFT_52121 [Peziza echinospora]
MPASTTSSRGSGVSNSNLSTSEQRPSPQPQPQPQPQTTTTTTTTTSTGSAANTRKRQRTLVSCTECHRRKQKCDRQWPCGNCTSRSASHLCQFERKVSRKDVNGRVNSKTTATTSTTNGRDQGHISEDSADNEDGDSDGMGELQSPDNAREFGYSITGTNNTSLNVLEKIDIGMSDKLRPVYSDRTFRFANPGDLATYNAFIRLIPARPYTSLLVRVFFTEVNFIYGVLHEGTFLRMLEEWWAIATAEPNARRESDQYITHDIHFFPALLLQVVACALQLLPKEHHEYLSQMKLGVRETFHDFSARLTAGACELVVLLGGTGTLSIARAQQAFLRATWLKNEGRMHEAWHSLGTAIRSAQEQGMHVEARQRGGQNNRELWYREIEKRVWINLYCWDRYMAMLLGRPTMINDKHCTVLPPLDAVIPFDLTQHAPAKRGVMDAPTLFTARILEHRLCKLVNELDDFNQTVTTSNPDFVRLDALHARIMAFAESFPPEFSITKRNASFDGSVPLLPVQATLLKCTFYSIIVALHRPFIFLREKSRREIVKACLIMLECQDLAVRLLEEHLHRIYSICFYTFDPCVLISAVVITNGSSLDENTLLEAVTAVREGWRRLRMLGMNVKLAEKGSVVLKVLLRKVETVVEKWKKKKELPGSTNSSNAMPEKTGSIQRRKSPTQSPNRQILKPARTNSTKAIRRPQNTTTTSVAHHHHPYPRPSPPSSVSSGANDAQFASRESASPLQNHLNFALSKSMDITPTGTAGTPSPPGFMDTLDSVLANAVYNPSATNNLHLQPHHHHHHQQLQHNHNPQHLQQQQQQHHHQQQHQYNQIPIDPSLVINWTTAAMNHLVSSSSASIPSTTSLSSYNDHHYSHNINPSRGDPTSGSSPSLSDNSSDYHAPPQDFFGSAGNGFGDGMEPWSSVEVVPGMNGGALSTVHGGNTITGPTDGMWQGLLGIFDHQGM